MACMRKAKRPLVYLAVALAVVSFSAASTSAADSGLSNHITGISDAEVGTLEDTPVPLVSGSYISVLIVRAGKLEKVMLEEWGRYVNFIQIHLQRHPNLRRVYLISAGAIIRDVTKKLIDYITNNVADLEFVDQVTYRARIYRGIPHMPQLVALFERK